MHLKYQISVFNPTRIQDNDIQIPKVTDITGIRVLGLLNTNIRVPQNIEYQIFEKF